jgi:hypothetical protein
MRRARKRLRSWLQKHDGGTRKRVQQDLHHEVSIHVRTRDGCCVLCGESDPQKLTSGHFCKRGWPGTAYDLRNCNCLCKSCNERDNEHPEFYKAYMLKRYGREVVAELLELKRGTRKVETVELEERLAEMRLLNRRAA